MAGPAVRPLTATELTKLQDKRDALTEEMAGQGLYFVKWTAAGLGVGVAATALLRLRGPKAYLPMLALGSVGTMADFAEAHRATNPLRQQLQVVSGAISRPNDTGARKAVVDMGVLPASAMDPPGGSMERR